MIYRVGNHQAQNVYNGDTYIGVMFSAHVAAEIVDVLNRHDAFTDEMLSHAPDSWDGEEAAEAIAIDYVREIERRLLALGGSLERWPDDGDSGVDSDAAYATIEPATFADATPELRSGGVVSDESGVHWIARESGEHYLAYLHRVASLTAPDATPERDSEDSPTRDDG